jgi:hypothetical protein
MEDDHAVFEDHVGGYRHGAHGVVKFCSFTFP